jgi:hypothetical protein
VACSGTEFLGLEAKGKMRCFLIAVAGLMLSLSGAAQAKIAITVDKNAQLMTVAVDGVERYQWPVSSGLPAYETPNGSFKTFRMEEDHYSKEFDDAPMPHAIFFTKQGHAIHGTDSVNRLGSPASHGCVRLSRANAATLYALVQKDGVLNATVTLTGSSQVALARNPRPRANTAVARRDPAPQYNAAGDPIVLAPRPGAPGEVAPLVERQVQPQAQADDGYIYPADGSSNEARYPAPRSRGVYGAQVYPREQYYYDRGYAPQYAPQGYYQPRQQYQYQPRGLFSYQD